jgi:hypothetical protein
MNSEAPSNPVSLLRLGASTSLQIDVFSDGIIQAVKQGEISAIEVLVQLKAFDKASGRILKEIQEHFVREAEKYPENSFTFNGNKIEKTEVGVKYDYSVCQDTEWERAHADEETAASKRQEREKFLKALTKPVVDPDTGAHIYPPNKTGTTSLKVTIK